MLDEPALNLPDGRDFRPPPRQYAYEMITALSEQRLALINGRPGASEERAARKARVPFRF